MAAKQSAVAGVRATGFQGSNVFDFAISNTFEHTELLPKANRIPKIEGSRPIFIDHKSDRTLTHGRIRQDSLALAAGLQSLGLDPNDVHALPPTPTCQRPEVAPVVLIQVPNCLSLATVLLGTFASGLTSTLVSPALTPDEIAWILQNSRPRAIITAKSCLPAMRKAVGMQEDKTFFSGVPIFTVDVAGETYPNHPATPADPQDWTALLTMSKRPLPKAHHFTPEASINRTAVILWSSGTSGRSKGVLLSHNALAFSTMGLWQDADYYAANPKQQHWLGYVPFYHVFGLVNILLLSVCVGASVYVMTSFNLETVLECVPRRGITYFHMAPPVAVMLAKAAVVEKYTKKDPRTGRHAFSSVSAGVTGGAPLGHEIVVQVYKRLGFRVRLGYGLSEACSTTLQNGTDEASMAAHAGDSGRPHWGVELMIASKEDTFTSTPTKPIGIGEDGEILIRCPALMSAYLPIGGLAPGAQPDMSVTMDALTKDGWFRTGDVGNLCAEGRLRITDRLKEMIKVRAFQVAPAELEAIICSDEDVADAGVVGVYDENEATEWPRAYVVPRKPGRSERELLELAQQVKRLVEGKTAKYKWLQGGIVFVDAIPKSPSGKILRRIMKAGEVKGFEVKVYERKRRDSKL